MKAEQLGYTNVRIYHDGMPAWKKGGNLIISSADFIRESIEKGIPFVLVDLRPKAEAEAGHIPGAVSIPADKLQESKDKFPADKSAPIVLYAADEAPARQMHKAVRDWGYKNTTALKGGFEAWKTAGGGVQAGAMPDVIAYVPKPRPGEISVDDFKAVAETLPAGYLILDIRDEDEAMQGMLKGAKNIPTTELKARLAEVPKDKKIVTHCVTGVRAEMAYHILKDAGYDAKFLNANIKIDPDGKYEITKD